MTTGTRAVETVGSQQTRFIVLLMLSMNYVLSDPGQVVGPSWCMDLDCAVDAVDRMVIDEISPPSVRAPNRKRKLSDILAGAPDGKEEEDLPVQAKSKIRRTEVFSATLGKSTKQTVWISCLLALGRHELVPCRICYKEPNAWVVQLKENAELQGSLNGDYLKGLKFWVKWNGEVVVDEHLPVVHVMHRA